MVFTFLDVNNTNIIPFTAIHEILDLEIPLPSSRQSFVYRGYEDSSNNLGRYLFILGKLDTNMNFWR